MKGEGKTINSQNKFRLTIVSFIIAITYLKNNGLIVHSFLSAVLFGKGFHEPKVCLLS